MPRATSNRQTALGAALSAVLGLHASAGAATTVHAVDSCDDDGPGSLRALVASAASGDTVDYSNLTCNTGAISLTTGAIAVEQRDLNIVGNPDIALIGKYDKVFAHHGEGTLALSGSTLGPATSSYGSAGGCIYSKGSVSLTDTVVSGCKVDQQFPLGNAIGGAVYAHGNVTLDHSSVTDSSASAASGKTFGGGIVALGTLTARYSTISGNSAGSEASTGFGGGAVAVFGMTLERVTVSANSASYAGGGVLLGGLGVGALSIRSSTISGNSAGRGGGIVAQAIPSVAIANSTIAFNTSAETAYAGGLTVMSARGGKYAVNVDLKLQSTLLSNNAAAAGDLDFAAIGAQATSVAFNGASAGNLVRTTTLLALPPDTITGACPLLGPLRNNGGWTQTHALTGNSAALDAGGNPNGEVHDQRSLALQSPAYPRISNGAADIGAFELDRADSVFSSNMEGCRGD